MGLTKGRKISMNNTNNKRTIPLLFGDDRSVVLKPSSKSMVDALAAILEKHGWVNNDSRCTTGSIIIIYQKGLKGEFHYSSSIPNPDANIKSFAEIVEEIDRLSDRQTCVMPFTIEGYAVTVFKNGEVHVGCKTATIAQLEQILEAYRGLHEA